MAGAAANSQPLLNIQTGVELLLLALSSPAIIPIPTSLQWSPNPVSAWTALTSATPGNGATNSLFDPAPIGSRTVIAFWK